MRLCTLLFVLRTVFGLEIMQMLDFNVPGGKLNRGLAVADLLLILKDGQVHAHTFFMTPFIRINMCSCTHSQIGNEGHFRTPYSSAYFFVSLHTVSHLSSSD
jgi:hypothetical protein